MAHVKESRPDSGLDFRAKVLQNLLGCPLFARKLPHRMFVTRVTRFEHLLPSIGQENKELFVYVLLVRIHFIIVMMKWTGLALWQSEFPFPGSLTSTFLSETYIFWHAGC